MLTCSRDETARIRDAHTGAPLSAFFELTEELATLEGDGFYERFAKWFLADRATRARSPFLR